MESSEHAQCYEYIVVGLGGFGSAALYWLSLRSKSVLGLEQFHLGHDHGSSQDWSRIIRYLYRDEKYVKLAKAAYQTWSDVERESGQKLVHKTGGLELSFVKGSVSCSLDACEKTMKEHDIPYERLDSSEIHRRWPQWDIPDDVEALYQADGGLVDAALANSTHIQLAEAHGAFVMESCRVIGFSKDSQGSIVVATTAGTFKCRRIVMCAASWTNEVLDSLGIHIDGLRVTQEQVTYVRTPHIKEFTKDRFPVYLFTIDDNRFYGLPSHVNSYVKVAIDGGGPVVTADSRTFTPDLAREAACVNFLKKYLPKSVGPVAYTKTCLYAATADHDFIIDDLSTHGWPEIALAIGGGHGFKFASVIGKILSEMAVDGKTEQDLAGFRLVRPAMTRVQHQAGLSLEG